MPRTRARRTRLRTKMRRVAFRPFDANQAMCGRDPPPTPDPVPTADNSNSSATPTSTGTAKAPVKPTSTGTTKAPAAAAGADNDGGVGTSTIAATIAAVLVVLVSVVVGYHYWQRRTGTDRPANAGEAGGARPGGGRHAGHTVENAAFERPGNAPDRGKSGSGARMRARETQNNPAGLQSTHGGQRAEQLSRAAGDPDYNYHDVLEFDAASHEYSSIAPVSEGACDHDHPDTDKYATETTRHGSNVCRCREHKSGKRGRVHARCSWWFFLSAADGCFCSCPTRRLLPRTLSPCAWS